MESVTNFATRLDKIIATLVVSENDNDRRFIGELLLTAAAAYLLKRYADSYLEGLGFDDMARKHGQNTKGFLTKLRIGRVTEVDVKKLTSEYGQEVLIAKGTPASPAACERAQSEIVTVLIEMGAVRNQAQAEASKIARWVVRDFQGSQGP